MSMSYSCHQQWSKQGEGYEWFGSHRQVRAGLIRTQPVSLQRHTQKHPVWFNAPLLQSWNSSQLFNKEPHVLTLLGDPQIIWQVWHTMFCSHPSVCVQEVTRAQKNVTRNPGQRKTARQFCHPSSEILEWFCHKLTVRCSNITEEQTLCD